MDHKHPKASKILRPTADNIKKAAFVIKNGGLVVFPTDTVYGLGCDAFNVNAVRKVFLVKKRNFNKPLPILIANFHQLEILTREISLFAKELIRKYWPGQLTIVFFKSDFVSQELTAGSDKVAVRWPKNRIVLDLIKESATPVVGTSANLSGKDSLISLKNLPASLLESVDVFLDGGDLQGLIASTIIDVTLQPPRILRKGAIDLNHEI